MDEYVKLPIHVLQALLKQPAHGEQWRRRAAREYVNREIKQTLGIEWTGESMGVSGRSDSAPEGGSLA